ncbi:hypothetical protein GA0070618_5821 [Micromonospora echinospora]|uniref:Uncharacterized protein n=1 Tax=Micromonospora echinospora TaxID=1877 RepID=A0A1C4ZV09_MICEC|nr:hypothetical protein [Micromonospora echinospora]SCF36775.1 hypothetical protein GA0070618_5821 [Micromonospora echinospora]
MAEAIGEKIARAVGGLAEHGLAVNVEGKGEGRVYRIRGKGCRLTVEVGRRGLSLGFTLDRQEASPELTYHVDTDLYDISDQKQQWFAVEIEDEIASFLGALEGGQVRVSRRPGKAVIVFPRGGGYARVERGRILTSEKHYERLEDAERGDSFLPLLA